MKKCKKCNVESNFVWDKDYFENTGKWRLYNQDTEQPHRCQVKEPEPRLEEIKSCPHPMCNKKVKASKLQAHVKQEHIDWGDYR
jgi:hypothetical protein